MSMASDQCFPLKKANTVGSIPLLLRHHVTQKSPNSTVIFTPYIRQLNTIKAIWIISGFLSYLSCTVHKEKK